MLSISSTEVQNNFGKYLQLAHEGEEIIIVKNGKEVARLISEDTKRKFLCESLVGVLKGNYSDEDVKQARLRKHENID